VFTVNRIDTVATTLTRITPPSSVSSVDPTIILRVWVDFFAMRFAAASSSNKVRSWPPVDVDQNALATRRLDFVQRGFAMAFSAPWDGANLRPRPRRVPSHRLCPFRPSQRERQQSQRVDQPGTDHQVCNAFDALIQHVICKRKCSVKVGFFIFARRKTGLLGIDDQ